MHRHPRRQKAWLALVALALLSAGCTASIEGDVTIDGTPLPGVAVTLTGLGETTVLTDEGGHYVLEDRLTGVEYTVTPALEGHVFGPAQRTASLVPRGLAGQDFVAAVDGVVVGATWEGGNPRAVIVTTEALAPAFQRLAVLHTTTGIPTEVVTVEGICGGVCDDSDPTRDTPGAVKAYLASRPGLAYAILGGDIEEVPSREVADSFFFALEVFGIEALVFEYTDLVFHSDHYYADFAEWDPDGDGVYAEEGEETPDYRPEIAVCRIPVSTLEEADAYVQKVRSYVSDHDVEAMGMAVMQAGVFTSFRHPLTGELFQISSAFYALDANRTLSLLESAWEVIRQFETANPVPDPAAEIYDDPEAFADRHVQLLQEGVHIVRYADHGTYGTLAPGIDADAAYALVNAAFPILLSETCHGAEFGAGDTAGEQVVKAPLGGAIAYCGQGTIGNSLLGANQLLDEIIRYAVTTRDPVLADAHFYAQDVLADVDDTFTFPLHLGGFPFQDVTARVVTEDNRRFAQKASVMLGDSLIPVWNEPRQPARPLEVTWSTVSSGVLLTLTADEVLSHAPVARIDGDYFTFDTVGTSFEIVLGALPGDVVVGFPSSTTQHFFAEDLAP